MKSFRLLFYFLFFVILIFIFNNAPFLNIPIPFRRAFHLQFRPAGLFEPIVHDSFNFGEVGYSKNFKLKPRFLDIYEIGITNEDKGISKHYEFTGILEIKYSWKDKLIYQEIVTKRGHAVYLKGNLNLYKNISLTTFNIPLDNQYKTDLNIQIKVIQPDKEIYKYTNDPQIYVAVSSIK